MNASPQFDLFGTPALPPRQIAPPAMTHVPAPPSVQWAKLLTGLGADLPVWLHVSRYWTGVILETACDGPRGRWGWHKTDGVWTFPADAGCRARIVYLDPPAAHALHAHRPLIRIGTGGDLAARFRFAADGEAATARLDLPLTADLTFEKVAK